MIHIVDNDVFRSGEKIGYLQGNDIYDREGRKAGYYTGEVIYDHAGRKVGYVKDGLLKQPDGDVIAKGINIRKEISGGTISDIERAAIRLLLGN